MAKRLRITVDVPDDVIAQRTRPMVNVGNWHTFEFVDLAIVEPERWTEVTMRFRSEAVLRDPEHWEGLFGGKCVGVREVEEWPA